MKLLFSIFIITFLFSQAISASDCSSELNDNEELEKLSCTIQNIANDIVSDKEVVPSKIYHYGKKEYLDEDIKERNIPQKVWDDFIMGDKTRFDLNKSRRGLYGTSGLDTNEFGGDTYNWLIEIAIKKECRDPSRVVSLMNLESDSKFIKWHEATKESMSLAEFKSSCSDSWDVYKGYAHKPCEEIVNKFLDDAHVGVIQDHIIAKSFYIRDRNCIDTIKGTPDEFVKILSEKPALWSTRCGQVAIPYVPGLLLQSLGLKENAIDNITKKKLIENASLILKQPHFGADKLNAALEAAQRCDLKKRNDFKDFVKNKVPHIDWRPGLLKMSDLQGLCADQ